MHPSPTRAVPLAAHEAQLAIIAGSDWSSADDKPKPPSRFGMESCFACATVKSPTPRMAWWASPTTRSISLATRLQISTLQYVPTRIRTSCVSKKCLCSVDWESVLGEGHEFLDEVCPLVQISLLSFVVEGSLRVKWQGGGGGSVAGGVVKV